MTAENVLLVDADDATVAAIKKHPAYRRRSRRPPRARWPAGHASFKLDYYRAVDMAQRLANAYA
ncbi:hypothetical protein [Micropruina sonneratiae]|uniref:hypothetical protein n=1 Tax=Micropruina sonneratiae TaxID=2986940 RepID=UPI002225BD1E|nr:hypothetical protein [Micropruina sp. KQZ13P-5]MCW3158160.1 hypothetical protein [Micropruina sp. KQZ13P-5]